MAGQVRNVLPAFAQRRQANLERVDAEVQVFAEFVVLDHLAQVAIGRADHAHIDAERLRVADAADFARFQEAQQLHLDVLVQLADFIEEQRAAVGDFEEALVIAVGPGERALAMAEQLAFDQVLATGRRS